MPVALSKADVLRNSVISFDPSFYIKRTFYCFYFNTYKDNRMMPKNQAKNPAFFCIAIHP
jgi:hypothetical protein